MSMMSSGQPKERNSLRWPGRAMTLLKPASAKPRLASRNHERMIDIPDGGGLNARTLAGFMRALGWHWVALGWRWGGAEMRG